MPFWEKEKIPPPERPEREILSEELDALKRRRADLELYIGTDAWKPDDRTLLMHINEEIARREEKLNTLQNGA